MASNSNALVLPRQASGTNALDIRPLKGPVEIPSSYGWVGWVVAAGVAAAIAWYVWKKLRVRKPGATPTAVIPPHRKAKDRLLAASGLMSDPYKFCSLVSDVLRSYVEERFNLHAPDRTTEEFMEELRASPHFHPAHKNLLEDFLSRCDLVKFARFEPSEPELQSLLDSAMRFVDETAPSEPNSPAEQKAAA